MKASEQNKLRGLLKELNDLYAMKGLFAAGEERTLIWVRINELKTKIIEALKG